MIREEPLAKPAAREAAKVAVVIPIPNDPDWRIFEELSEEIPVIVVDDSDGKLSPAPRSNVRFYDYAAQREVMGTDYPAIPHKSAACRNFGHYLAYREGFDVIVALDYDCRPRAGWLQAHLDALRDAVDAPALRGAWINSVTAEGFYARGFPYEYRNPKAASTVEDTASGKVKLNMGLWDNVLDLNGIDKLQKQPPYDPGLHPGPNRIALGNIPVCGMNTAFAAELTPAYFFLPDVLVSGSWQLSRHDDIWGGYVLKKLMDLRGDLFAWGAPIVEHTRQSNLERTLVIEQWMHLMARGFFACADEAAARVRPGAYPEMFGAFVEEFLAAAGRSPEPLHYREVYGELGRAMLAWAECFR